MTDELFPDVSELIFRAHQSIAAEIGCSFDLVDNILGALPAPPWNSPDHLRRLGGTANLINEAARHARNLHRSMSRLGEAELSILRSTGAISLEQIEHLCLVLVDDALTLRTWHRERGKLSRKNLAAHDTAEGVRRIYRRLRRPITWGMRSDGDGPSTEFGRSVEHAIGAFGIAADWRRPTEAAYNKHHAIQNRHGRCAMAKVGLSG